LQSPSKAGSERYHGVVISSPDVSNELISAANVISELIDSKNMSIERRAGDYRIIENFMKTIFSAAVNWTFTHVYPG
jgi:hypothetical protein